MILTFCLYVSGPQGTGRTDRSICIAEGNSNRSDRPVRRNAEPVGPTGRTACRQFKWPADFVDHTRFRALNARDLMFLTFGKVLWVVWKARIHLEDSVDGWIGFL